jgi:hypothetical protein
MTKYFEDLPPSIRAAILKLEGELVCLAELEGAFNKQTAAVVEARTAVAQAIFDREADELATWREQRV